MPICTQEHLHRFAYVCAFARMSTYLYISLTYIHTFTTNLKHIMCLLLVLQLKHLQAGGVHALVVVIRAGQSRSVSDAGDVMMSLDAVE